MSKKLVVMPKRDRRKKLNVKERRTQQPQSSVEMLSKSLSEITQEMARIEKTWARLRAVEASIQGRLIEAAMREVKVG